VENITTESEYRSRLLSSEGSHTVFVKEDENGNQKNGDLPNRYDWFGPIPREGEMIHISKHGSDGYYRHLKVTEICWSAMVKGEPAMSGAMFIHCEIMVEDVAVDRLPKY
jgi:hypothetical protein